jgi:hypothetical protein
VPRADMAVDAMLTPHSEPIDCWNQRDGRGGPMFTVVSYSSSVTAASTGISAA